MRHCSSREDGMCEYGGGHNMQSPSEIPTLPLRGGNNSGVGIVGRRTQAFQNLRNTNMNSNINRRASYSSSQTSLPPSPNKMTRF